MPVYRESIDLGSQHEEYHILDYCTQFPDPRLNRKCLLSASSCMTFGTRTLHYLPTEFKNKVLRKGQIYEGYFIRTINGPYDYCYKIWTRRQCPFAPLNTLIPHPEELVEAVVIDRNDGYFGLACGGNIAYSTDETFINAGIKPSEVFLPMGGIKVVLRKLYVKRPPQIPYAAFEATGIAIIRTKDYYQQNPTILLPFVDDENSPKSIKLPETKMNIVQATSGETTSIPYNEKGMKSMKDVARNVKETKINYTEQDHIFKTISDYFNIPAVTSTEPSGISNILLNGTPPVSISPEELAISRSPLSSLISTSNIPFNSAICELDRLGNKDEPKFSRELLRKSEIPLVESEKVNEHLQIAESIPEKGITPDRKRSQSNLIPNTQETLTVLMTDEEVSECVLEVPPLKASEPECCIAGAKSEENNGPPLQPQLEDNILKIFSKKFESETPYQIKDPSVIQKYETNEQQTTSKFLVGNIESLDNSNYPEIDSSKQQPSTSFIDPAISGLYSTEVTPHKASNTESCTVDEQSEGKHDIPTKPQIEESILKMFSKQFEGGNQEKEISNIKKCPFYAQQPNSKFLIGNTESMENSNNPEIDSINEQPSNSLTDNLGITKSNRTEQAEDRLLDSKVLHPSLSNNILDEIWRNAALQSKAQLPSSVLSDKESKGNYQFCAQLDQKQNVNKDLESQLCVNYGSISQSHKGFSTELIETAPLYTTDDIKPCSHEDVTNKDPTQSEFEIKNYCNHQQTELNKFSKDFLKKFVSKLNIKISESSSKDGEILPDKKETKIEIIESVANDMTGEMLKASEIEQSVITSGNLRGNYSHSAESHYSENDLEKFLKGVTLENKNRNISSTQPPECNTDLEIVHNNLCKESVEIINRTDLVPSAERSTDKMDIMDTRDIASNQMNIDNSLTSSESLKEGIIDYAAANISIEVTSPKSIAESDCELDLVTPPESLNSQSFGSDLITTALESPIDNFE